ncbi:zinc ribbon domain-containing protein [Micromonospora sp. CB01531]|uniref:zinc ribbon domain-containing protein n=1 Tax=Micromonospora sp. CB01531 TaxID=1718947 RepID=UPI0018E9F1E7
MSTRLYDRCYTGVVNSPGHKPNPSDASQDRYLLAPFASCHQCGDFGRRSGDRFHCTRRGVVWQADVNAAINILHRAGDPDIALHTPHHRVKQILQDRADRHRTLRGIAGGASKYAALIVDWITASRRPRRRAPAATRRRPSVRTPGADQGVPLVQTPRPCCKCLLRQRYDPGGSHEHPRSAQ